MCFYLWRWWRKTATHYLLSCLTHKRRLSVKLAQVPRCDSWFGAANRCVKQKVRGIGKLRGLDGRPIFCRADAALNYLLQSAGAILSKRWVVIGQDLIDEAGLTYNRDYTRCAYVHDEVQLSVVPSEADRVMQLLEAAAPLAGEYYNFKVPISASADKGESWASTHWWLLTRLLNF